jgi:hypothetical protein
MSTDFADIVQTAPPKATVEPIRFPDQQKRHDAFARRAERIQAERERMQTLLREANSSGFTQGFTGGYERGSRFGFWLGVIVASICAAVIVAAR